MSAVVLDIHKHAFSFMYSVIFSTQSSLLLPCTYAFLKCCNLLLKTCFFFTIIYKGVQGQIFISFETVYWYENKSESIKKECTFIHTYLFVKRKVKKRNKYFIESFMFIESGVFFYEQKMEGGEFNCTKK